MRRIALVVLIGVVGAAVPVAAQGAPPSDPCPDAVTQRDLTECAVRARDASDAELNRVYRSLLSQATDPQARRIRAAQRLWLPFRDAHCEVESAAYEGGSIQPMVLAFCLADVTRERTAHLRAYAESLGR